MELKIWHIILIIIYLLCLINSIYVIITKSDLLFKKDPTSEYTDEYGCTKYFSYTPFTNAFIMLNILLLFCYLLTLIGSIEWNKVIISF